MNPDQKIARLDELERKERQGQRKASRIAWISVGLAAIILAVLIVASYYQLSSIRGNIAELKREQGELIAENEKLTADNEAKRKLLWEIEVPPGSGGPATQAPPVAAAPRPSPAPASLPPRIYMHIAERRDRDFANRMSRALAGRNFLVIGTEYIPEAGKLKRTQVRYYKKADAATAGQIVEVLSENGAPGAQAAYLERYEYSTTVRPRVFEIWFPPNVGERRTSVR